MTAWFNKDEEEIENDQDIFEALKKTLDSINERLTKLESAIKLYKRDELAELKEELKHRSRYIESVFEQVLEKDFAKAGVRMYRNGKMAGPVGRLP